MSRGWVVSLLLVLAAAAACTSTVPAGPEVHPEAARQAYVEGDMERAATEAKLAIQQDPLAPDPHFLLACLLEQQGERDQAMVGFQRAWRLDPANHLAAYNVGTMFLRREDAVPAARWFETALSSNQDHVASYTNLGKAYFLAGLPELAVAAYQEALRREPSNAVAQENLALLLEAGRAHEGPKAGGQVEALRPEVPGQEVKPKLGAAGPGAPPPGPPLVPDPQARVNPDLRHMIEVDATIFVVIGVDRETLGFNFLKMINFTFDYFASDHNNEGSGFIAPGFIGAVTGASQSGWIMAASVDYDVTIANAVDERVAVLARPHLTTLSGTPATFRVGGEVVFRVAGNISGDIKPYPFGTTLNVTPTLLPTPAEDGNPRVHLKIEAGRKSILDLLAQEAADLQNAVIFDDVQVTSEAILGLDRTLILSGLDQKERRSGNSGVPLLRDLPILRYVFATRSNVEVDTAVIILLTPRDPAYQDAQNRDSIRQFVEMRRAFIAARRGTAEDFRLFTERYPHWQDMPPNRFASHFFLLANSELYRTVSGEALTEEDIELDLLGTQKKP